MEKNQSKTECFVSDDDIRLAQTIATYIGVTMMGLCTCLIGRCFCKRPC